MKKKLVNGQLESFPTEVTSEIHEVVSFTQRPSENQFDNYQNVHNSISASDLFSFFTANIIKEKIVFTR